MSGYSFAVLATFEEKLPVQYIIRINSPNGHNEDYVCNLECLTNIGELLTTLKYFAETELYPEDSKKTKKYFDSREPQKLRKYTEIKQNARQKVVKK